MTKREQKLLDNIYLADTEEEQTIALIEAIEEIPEDQREVFTELLINKLKSNRSRSKRS